MLLHLNLQVPSSPEGAAAAEGTKQGASETVNNSLNESTQDKAFTTAQVIITMIKGF